MTYFTHFTPLFLLLYTSISHFFTIHQYKNRVSSLHIFVHHCTFCASLHIKTSPALNCIWRDSSLTDLFCFFVDNRCKLLCCCCCVGLNNGNDSNAFEDVARIISEHLGVNDLFCLLLVYNN